jgi:FkbM family methyltransferase
MRTVDDLLRESPLRIVDIGASGGIHPRWRALTSEVTAVLFEPDPRARESLQHNNPAGTTVLESALSDAEGLMEFHQCRKQEVSSVYLPDFELLARYPYSERFAVLNTTRMRVDTLDNQLAAAGIPEVDFIKVDTQGHELSVLRGCQRTLAHAVGVEIEVAFVRVYKGQPLFCEVDAFAKSHGFSLIDLRRTYWRRGNSSDYGGKKGQLVIGDALYFRAPEGLADTQGVTPQRIVRAIGVYLAYGYPDLAQTAVDGAARTGLLDPARLRLAAAAVDTFKSHWMPEFAGRRRLKRVLQRIANLFSDQGPYTGADGELGNVSFPPR